MKNALVLSILIPLFQLTVATVFVNQAEHEVCKGLAAEITCTTTTGTGFLSWLNSQGQESIFDNTAFPGKIGTLGSTIILTLSNVEQVSGAVVFTSTAIVDNILENTTIQCSDGDALKSIDIFLKSPSSPLWAKSACNFCHSNMTISWNDPAFSPDCCAQYIVHLSKNIFETINTSFTMPIEDKAITATVHCINHVGIMVTQTEEMIVNSRIAIEHIAIEPVGIISCIGNITYLILWTTSAIGQNECTPPIIKSTITCTTLSISQSSEDTQSMICSVPANESVTATVNVTTAAGITDSKSATAVNLAQFCSKKNILRTHSTPSPSPPPSVEPTTEIQTAKIAAYTVGVGQFIIIVLIIIAFLAVIVFLVKKHYCDSRQMNPEVYKA